MRRIWNITTVLDGCPEWNQNILTMAVLHFLLLAAHVSRVAVHNNALHFHWRFQTGGEVARRLKVQLKMTFFAKI